MSNLTEILNARHEDLNFELSMLINNKELLKNNSSKLGIENEISTLVSNLQNYLMDKLDLNLEDIAEEEEIDVSEVTDELVLYSIKEALNDSRIEMKSYLQIDNMINQILNLGGTEEEVEGLRQFKSRLETVVFTRYNVSKQDLVTEGVDNE